MKNKTKRLILAVCLLLISATLLGTASFAWFSMNTEVTVDGIEVEAYSDALFLEISEDNSDYDTSITLTSGGKKTLRLVKQLKINETDTVYNIAPVAADGYYDGGSTVYYKPGSVEGNDDTYAARNYIAIDNATLTAADDISALYAVEISAAGATAVEGVLYCRRNGAGYTVISFNAGDALAEDIRILNVKNYFEYDSSAETYTPVKLYEGDSLSGYYTATFTAATGTAVDGTYYYTEDAGVYTKATVTAGADVSTGYFTAAITACGTDDTAPALFNYNGSDKYTLATPTRGSSLAGLYTIDESDSAQYAELDPTSASGDIYVKNGNDYVFVCTKSSAEDITDELFWGRAYSDTLGDVNAGASLNIIKSNEDKYYYYDTIYLRSAANTNEGQNIRIENVTIGGRENDLSDALRVLFVATNGAGEVVATTYSNRDGMASFDGDLFETILGNKGEVVTVDMYVYFDGTDAAALTLATGDAGLLNGQTVSVKFAIDGPDYTVNP